MDQHPLFTNKKILALLDQYKPVWALSYLKEVSERDRDTYMPIDANQYRAEALAQVTLLIQQIFTKGAFINSYRETSLEKDLNDYEKGILRITENLLKEYIQLSPDFLSQLTENISLSRNIWVKAKENNDFGSFAPYLDKIVVDMKKKAEILGYQENMYTAWIDHFDSQTNVEMLTKYFEEIREKLPQLLQRVRPEFLQGKKKLTYDKEKLNTLISKVLQYLGFDEKVSRQDLTSHPFATAFGINKDVRITTAYREDFDFTLSSSIHEYGHAMYDLQSDDRLNTTPLLSEASMSIHESQSRFWENFFGRSLIVVELFLEDFRNLGEDFASLSAQEIYYQINQVSYSPIRIEADELTYHLHILVRFEIEQALASGELETKDIPDYWNTKYKEYLGIDIKNDSEGCLQDVHRSIGYFGYFPSYSVGTALSAIWKEMLEKDIGAMGKLIQSTEGISQIKKWLKEYIHQFGYTYTLKQLLQKHNVSLTASPLLTYLEEKYC